MTELVVTFVSVPQGLPLPVQDEPVMLQFTAVCEVPVTVAVMGIERPRPATDWAPSLTVTAGQLVTHGPLPPVAHPVANAMLNRAVANRIFLIIIEVTLRLRKLRNCNIDTVRLSRKLL